MTTISDCLFRNEKLPANNEEFYKLFSPLTFADDKGTNFSALIGGYHIYASFPLFWPQIRAFPFRQGDVVISSFPKSGTTWLQQITYLVMTQDFEGASSVPIDVRAPFLEYPRPPVHSTLDELGERPSPRLIKTHLGVEFLPKRISEAKVLYIHRNPKDVVVSYYFHNKARRRSKNVVQFQKTFEEFARDFIDGDVMLGPYAKQVGSYFQLKRQQDPEWLLMLSYEELKQDTKTGIRKIAAFLEKDLTDEIVDRIYKETTVETMRDNDAVNYSWFEKAGTWEKETSRFIRKGIAGDWVNHFSDAQLLEDFEHFMAEQLPDELKQLYC